MLHFVYITPRTCDNVFTNNALKVVVEIANQGEKTFETI